MPQYLLFLLSIIFLPPAGLLSDSKYPPMTVKEDSLPYKYIWRCPYLYMDPDGNGTLWVVTFEAPPERLDSICLDGMMVPFLDTWRRYDPKKNKEGIRYRNLLKQLEEK